MDLLPVTNVDVSLTGQSEWLPARLETPKGPYRWQNWSFDLLDLATLDRLIQQPS